jgi:cell division initiation protein
MKLSPQDILSQKFSVKVKGYDKDEVNHFLVQIAEILETETLERESIKKELERVREKLFQLQKREDVLRDTLISAQKFSHEIKMNAEKESELVIKEAEIKAEAIINNAIGRQRELKEEIRNLKFKRTEIESDIVAMLNSLRELIESYRKDDDEFEKLEYLAR